MRLGFTSIGRASTSGWLPFGLAAALIGLGSWVLVDRYAGGSSSSASATTLLDKFTAAASRGDGKAANALVTNDFVFETGGGAIAGPKELASEIGPYGLTLDRIAPVSVNGDYATTFIQVNAAGGVYAHPMLGVAQIKDGKIARLWTFILGETVPFDKIATH